jgi:tetratricopeptide (TPR) repeat protein
MRRKSGTNQLGRTSTHADSRVGFGGEKLDIASALPEIFLQAGELSSRGKWRESVRICRKGLAIQPDNLTGLLLLGTALWKIGEAEEAERTLILARKELEKHAQLYSTLAEISEHKGDFELADKMLGLYKTLSQTDLDQAISPPSKNATAADGDTAFPVHPGLERLNRLAAAFQSRSSVSRSKHSLFADNERWLLKRILQNS